MLIDDDEATNFLNEIIIEDAGCAEQVIIFDFAENALNYLKDEKSIIPDLIFLDINMPRMDGWEFLAFYDRLDPVQKAEAVVVMLTNHLHPKDADKVKSANALGDFMTKPLTEEKLTDILEKYF